MSRVEINQAALTELLTGPTSPVRKAVKDFADKVVEEVRTNGPIADVEQYLRPPGALRADMRIRSETADESGITITVGTDPVNPSPTSGGDHYAERVHTGRGPINSARPMVFKTRSGGYTKRFSVGPADPDPFLFKAADAANATSDVQFGKSWE